MDATKVRIWQVGLRAGLIEEIYMNLKASPGLKLVVIALTMALATLPIYLIEGWYKWLIGAAVLVVGTIIENRMERAFLVADKTTAK